MPYCNTGAATLYYETHGNGFPLLLIAPGGMRSEHTFWERTPWNPITQLKDRYRVIAMDQRNAGYSTAPVSAADGWESYTNDQLALMDHLGYEKFHVAGMCIGGSYIMALAAAAPERVASGVVFQTIGLDDNRQAFYEMFDSWAKELKEKQPNVADSAWESFKERMYGVDKYLFTADEDDTRRCQTPLLVLLGNDLYHPESSSRKLAELAPNATLIEHWKEPEHHATAMAAMESFLAQHT